MGFRGFEGFLVGFFAFCKALSRWVCFRGDISFMESASFNSFCFLAGSVFTGRFALFGSVGPSLRFSPSRDPPIFVSFFA